MGGDFLALVKGENRHADLFVLHKSLAYNLTGHIVHKLFKLQFFLFFDIFIHKNLPFGCLISQILYHTPAEITNLSFDFRFVNCLFGNSYSLF